MNIEEKLEIALKLQKYHYFFRNFWDIGNPVVSDFEHIKTAAIEFDKEGNAIKFLINEKFWATLDDETKLFLICHEMLHIILKHGIRFVQYHGTADFQTMNIAADVVINELLVRTFNFDRNNLFGDLKEKGCWYDTVFKDDPNILKEESTEYYFNKLKDQNEKQKKKDGKDGQPDDSKPFFIDDHIVQSVDSIEKIQDILKENKVVDNLVENYNKNFPTDIMNDIIAGFGLGGEIDVTFKKIIKKKWETVIKKWEILASKRDITSVERWELVSPRYSHVISDKINLPSEHKLLEEYKEKDKMNVFFFLDTSGSCVHLAERFFTAAASINPKKFNVRLFCFDTRVHEVDLKSKKAIGGGGTFFNIIEDKIQTVVKTEKTKYPSSVWIITDGYGTNVVPQFPKKWFWFLTENGSTSYIPKECKVFNLANFE